MTTTNNNGNGSSKVRHLNLLIMEGYLGRDPARRYLPTGTAITTLRLACNYSWTGVNGEVKSEATWIDVEVLGKQAEVANSYLKKSSHVIIEGRLRPLQQWEHEGKQYSKMVLRANLLRMLDGLKDNAAPAGVSDDTSPGDDIPY